MIRSQVFSCECYLARPFFVVFIPSPDVFCGMLARLSVWYVFLYSLHANRIYSTYGCTILRISFWSCTQSDRVSCIYPLISTEMMQLYVALAPDPLVPFCPVSIFAGSSGLLESVSLLRSLSSALGPKLRTIVIKSACMRAHARRCVVGNRVMRGSGIGGGLFIPRGAGESAS